MSDIRARSEAIAAPGMPRGRARNITLWVIQILLAAFFALAALPKLTGQQDTVYMFTRIGAGQWFRYFTGSLELAGAIGLLIPRLSGLASLGLAGVMVGAFLTQLLVFASVPAALLPAAVCVVLALLAWGRWPQIRDLVSRLTR